MLALLYDVHGNLAALEAVLDDARAQGADRWLIGGDVALFGAQPAETLAALRSLGDATWIRGNAERWTADPDSAPEGPVRDAIAYLRGALGDDDVAALAALPESAVLDARTRAWHASPVSDMRSFLPEPADDEAELLAGVTEERLVFGHTHLPFRRTSAERGIELVNPGSVGLPLDGDVRPSYALLHDDGGVEHRRVAYDHAAAAQALRSTDGGAAWAQTFATRLEAASFDA
jgi:predicted phosphodiesterase